jgi:hypothetical protein
MPVARINFVSVLRSHQPGSWHGTQNRRRSLSHEAYHVASVPHTGRNIIRPKIIRASPVMFTGSHIITSLVPRHYG